MYILKQNTQNIFICDHKLRHYLIILLNMVILITIRVWLSEYSLVYILY